MNPWLFYSNVLKNSIKKKKKKKINQKKKNKGKVWVMVSYVSVNFSSIMSQL